MDPVPSSLPGPRIPGPGPWGQLAPEVGCVWPEQAWALSEASLGYPGPGGRGEWIAPELSGAVSGQVRCSAGGWGQARGRAAPLK